MEDIQRTIDLTFASIGESHVRIKAFQQQIEQIQKQISDHENNILLKESKLMDLGKTQQNQRSEELETLFSPNSK
jgi:hypothetical protein